MIRKDDFLIKVLSVLDDEATQGRLKTILN